MTNDELRSTISLCKKFQNIDTYRMGLCIQALETQQKLREWIDNYKSEAFDNVSWDRDELLSVLGEFVVLGRTEETPTIEPNTIIHCNTEEKAEALLQIAHAQGWQWAEETPLLDDLHYTKHQANTCYFFTGPNRHFGKKVEFCSRKYYEENTSFYPKVISFDDFIQRPEKEQQRPLTM